MTHAQYFGIRKAIHSWKTKGTFPSCVNDAVTMTGLAEMFKSYMAHEEAFTTSEKVASAGSFYGMPVVNIGAVYGLQYVK